MTAEASCGEDKVVVGGGYQKIGKVDITLMIPVDFGAGRLLHVSADTDGTAHNTPQVYAFCVDSH